MAWGSDSELLPISIELPDYSFFLGSDFIFSDPTPQFLIPDHTLDAMELCLVATSHHCYKFFLHF